MRRLGLAASFGFLLVSVAHAAEPLLYPGRVEAARQAALSTRINGVVSEVLFSGGDEVSQGQPLIRLDPVDAQLDLAAAEAALARATAELQGAERAATRQQRLAERGISPDAVVGPAITARAAAQAAVRLAEAHRDRAAMDLERTIIRAPIGGLISPAQVIVGQFIEAEAGPPLATIVDLDPVLVAYDAPYSDRLALLSASNAASVDALLARIRVELALPGGRTYPIDSAPHTAGPTVDADTGTVRVWAYFDNPDRLLRPGMAVTVRSHVDAP
ncbi:MAG: efflux RND transporter periplasmic adaptor subunit [Pseudomonadota bacterium]